MTITELLKIIGIGIFTLIAYITIKPIKPDIAIFISLAGGIIILIFCINAVSEVILTVTNLVEKTGIDGSLFSIILKIIGVGYLVEFACGLCTEAGASSISDKIALAGKVCVLVMSLPIITNLINIIVEILP